MTASRLGVRSAYSLLYGVRGPADIAARAAEYGAKTLAICDRDNLYGLHSTLEATREAGLRPVIGAELSVKPSADSTRTVSAATGSATQVEQGSPGRIFAFVRDRAGFSRLCECLTLAKAEERDHGKARADFDLVQALREDAAGLALATTSPVLLEALAGRVPTLYAAVTPSSVAAARTAARLGIPLVALDDATFLDPEDRAAHAVLRAMALRKTVGTLGTGDTATEGELFLSAADFERRLRSWPEALRNSGELAASCAFDTVFDGFVFPEYHGPGDDNRDPATELRARVIAGARRRYGELSDAIIGRIDYELGIIGCKGFAPYFLVMDDIVSMSSRTCGRGSGAASIVAYSLGITNVDPIAYKLYFERFLTLSRLDPPDIDVDFAWDERPDLIRRVIERFGADRCARVANHNSFRPRSAFRETAKAYGFSDGEVSAMERRVFDLRDREALVDPPWDEILALARRIEGLPRGLSTHCGGLVIAPGPMCRYAPVERSPEGFPLLAWEKDGAEASGLVKLDLLGNRSLAVIRDALANLRARGIDIDEALWRPAEDPATVAALARGDSMGVFYIESPAMRQLQKKTGAGDFDHIVIHSSIIRPAANKLIAEYVERLKGKPWKPLHPRLEGILDETYGIVCYQEDVSKVAIALAGFGEDEADRLRKVISKKAGAAKLAVYRDRFFAGCAHNGVDGPTTETAWAMLLSFDGYSFCKPHSASYAMVSFQSAWLRVHHPAEFIAAVLSNQGGYYRPQAYVSEARRMGLSVRGPDVNLSAWRYRGEDGTVIVGLMAIAGLSRTAADAIIAERERRGPFADLAEFSARMGSHGTRPARDDIVSLVASGAFDSLPHGSAGVASSGAASGGVVLGRASRARILLYAGAGGACEYAGQSSLFESSARPVPPPTTRRLPGDAIARVPANMPVNAPAHAPDMRRERELHDEFETLGFLRDSHPLVLWASKIVGVPRVRGIDITQYVGRNITLVGWPVTQKEVLTSGGQTMDFVSLEDETALYETVFFPEAYARFRHLLLDQRPLIVTGAVTDDQGAPSVVVTSVRPLQATASL